MGHRDEAMDKRMVFYGLLIDGTFLALSSGRKRKLSFSYPNLFLPMIQVSSFLKSNKEKLKFKFFLKRKSDKLGPFSYGCKWAELFLTLVSLQAKMYFKIKNVKSKGSLKLKIKSQKIFLNFKFKAKRNLTN